MALVVNFFGGPGAGKSTLAANLYVELKRRGHNVSLLKEFAKEKTIERNKTALGYQTYITGMQIYNQSVSEEMFDVVISDSPIPLGVFYNVNMPKAVRDVWEEYILAEFRRRDNINYFINRAPEALFNKTGRNQDETEALKIDLQILEYLNKNEINFTHTIVTEAPTAKMLADVEARIEALKN